MVETTPTVTERTMKEAIYGKDRAAERKKSTWYRYLFPEDADWTVKENPYAKYDKSKIFDKRNNFYHSNTNDFHSHYQQ